MGAPSDWPHRLNLICTHAPRLTHPSPPPSSYTATILSIDTDADGKVTYKVEYEDESTHKVSRATTLDKLSSMPVPARRFVEFGHDELKLIWEPDVHVTNLHQDMLVHEEVPGPRNACAHA